MSRSLMKRKRGQALQAEETAYAKMWHLDQIFSADRTWRRHEDRIGRRRERKGGWRAREGDHKAKRDRVPGLQPRGGGPCR
jgi:hypothetical protein